MKSARLVKSWTNGRVMISPWQAVPEQMAALGLSDEDGMVQVWFVDARGRLFGGAEAVNRVLRLVWWIRPFTYLYSLPGVRQLEDRVYRWVAANRHRLPGSTKQCRLPGQDAG